MRPGEGAYSWLPRLRAFLGYWFCSVSGLFCAETKCACRRKLALQEHSSCGACAALVAPATTVLSEAAPGPQQLPGEERGLCVAPSFASQWFIPESQWLPAWKWEFPCCTSAYSANSPFSISPPRPFSSLRVCAQKTWPSWACGKHLRVAKSSSCCCKLQIHAYTLVLPFWTFGLVFFYYDYY